MTEDAQEFTEHVAGRAAAAAAFTVAKGRHPIVFNGKRDAMWRVRDDGAIEVARDEWGRVELFEVSSDGVVRLVETSARSSRKVAAAVAAALCGSTLVVGVLGSLVGVDALAVLIGLAFLLFPVSLVLGVGSTTRPWLRQRFGSDHGWADVPWEIEGTPPTGNQTIALTALAEGGSTSYRIREDESLEVVRRGSTIEVLTIDTRGRAVPVDTLRRKGFDLKALRGPEVTWHRVVDRDPSD